MNPSDKKWPRLAAAARRAGDPRDTSAPVGFATRVAALGLAPGRAAGSLLERFSFRALGLAALLAVVCVATNYSTLVGALSDEAASADDPVAEIVDLAT
jgi:hypothetical protein